MKPWQEIPSDDDEDNAVDCIEPLDGLFVGQLTVFEKMAFDLLCDRKIAYRSYEGAAGALGLARVRLRRLSDDPAFQQRGTT